MPSSDEHGRPTVSGADTSTSWTRRLRPASWQRAGQVRGGSGAGCAAARPTSSRVARTPCTRTSTPTTTLRTSPLAGLADRAGGVAASEKLMRLRKAIDEKRRRRGRPLGEARVSPITKRRYDEARSQLQRFWRQQGTRPASPQEFDEGVAAFIEHVWKTGGSILTVNCVIAAVPFSYQGCLASCACRGSCSRRGCAWSRQSEHCRCRLLWQLPTPERLCGGNAPASRRY